MLRELTSHKVNGVTESISLQADEDTIGAGGAVTTYHYLISNPPDHPAAPNMSIGSAICFQNGTLPEVGANGLTQEALLAIVEDRLKSFQAGPYACRENALALTHIQEAMHWLHHRTRERVARGVEGTHAE
jgi:hypothetical protein